ncbi:autotransporter-associated beta strand repeat-containing protein, partial [Cyanobium sp. Cruz-8H5]|uniref:beta strand repeat-containing protein n=1 Tax=Cyanobium sp. Cruz-8H5 TaxID=2823712 RepID=UPI0020CCA090
MSLSTRSVFRRRALLLAMMGVCSLSPGNAVAADFWWRGDLSGTWSDTATILGGIVNTNFATDSNGLFDRFALPGAGDVVRFAPSNGSNLFTTLGTNFAIDGLTTELSLAGNVSIVGANTLTIGSSGIVLGASRVMTISSGLATTTFSHFINTANGFSELNLNGSISASPIAKSGAGLLRITGNNMATSIAIDGGTVRLGSAAGYRTNTPLTINAGTFDLGGISATVSNLRFGTGASGGPRNIINSVAGSAAITLNGSLTYTGPGAAAIVSAPIIFSPGQHIIENTGGVFSDAFYDIVLDGALSGTGGLTKRGSAYLALTRPGIHSGATVIENGRLYAAGDGVLSDSSDLTVTSPGQLLLDPSSNSPQVIAGSYSQSVRSLSGNGAISLGFAELNVSGPATTTFSGVISGFGAVRHSGSGKLTLTGANTYANETRIFGGTLEIGNGGTTGSIAGNINLAGGSLIFNRSNNVFFTGSISGNGGTITKLGGGTLLLSGSSPSLRSSFLIRQGSVETTGAFALGDGSDVTVGEASVAATALLDTRGVEQRIRDLTLYARAGAATTAVTVGTGTLTIEGDLRVLDTTSNAGDNFSTVIAASPGGRLFLLGSGGGGGSQQSITVAGQNISLNDLVIQPVITGFNGLNITANPSTFNGTPAGVIFAATSTNTYQGDTTVSAGTLTVNSTTSLGLGSLILNTTGNVASRVILNNAAQRVVELQTPTVGTAAPVLALNSTALTIDSRGDFSGIIQGTGSITLNDFVELTL